MDRIYDNCDCDVMGHPNVIESFVSTCMSFSFLSTSHWSVTGNSNNSSNVNANVMELLILS